MGYFYDQAAYHETYHEQPRYQSFPWAAKWIRPDYSDTSNACFRKTFYVGSDVKGAYIVVAAAQYYELRVNGILVRPFFGANPTSPNISGSVETPNVVTGNDLKTNVAQIYDIRQELFSGENTITVRVQSDDNKPLLAAQAYINSSVPQTILTDATWTCSDHQEVHNKQMWTSNSFDASTWRHSISTGQPAALPVDGDYTILDRPFAAQFLSAPGAKFNQSCLLATKLDNPGGTSTGWLRVICAVPYDIILNNALIYSTSTQNRSLTTPMARYHMLDAFPRSRYSSAGALAPTQFDSARVSIFPLSNLLSPGENVLMIALHPQASMQSISIPAIYIDGVLNFGNGQNLQISRGSNWLAHVDGSAGTWQRAATYSVPSEDAWFEFGAWHDTTYLSNPGEYRKRLATFSVLACAALFLVSFLFALAYSSPAATLGDVMRMSAYFCCPTALLLGAILCAQITIPYTPQDTILSSATFGQYTVAAGAALVAAMLVWLRYKISRESRFVFRSGAHSAGKPANSSLAKLSAWGNRYGFAAGLASLMLICGVVCVHGISINPFLNDEYVSILCTRGILRTGIPIYQHTGIIYGRSSLYHYLLAPFLWLGITYHNLYLTRLLSAIWQVALLPLVYVFTKNLRGRWVALAAVALIAFSPSMLFFARETRFYSQFAFFSVLTFYLLLRSLQAPDRHGYKVASVAAFIGAYLSQELAVSMLPSILGILLISHQLRAWRNKYALMAIAALGIVVCADMYVYFKYCSTPLPNVDRDAMPLLAFHTDNLELTASMLISGAERTQLPLGMLFLLGLVGIAYNIARRPSTAAPRLGAKPYEQSGLVWKWWSYLYVIAIPTLIVSSVIIPVGGVRYVVELVPILTMIASCMMAYIARFVIRAFQGMRGVSLPLLRMSLVAALVIVCYAAYRPVRLWDATTRKLNRDHTAAAQFIAQHEQPGDKIMFFDPQAAMVELDQCDYYYVNSLKSLYKYESADGRLRERNSGAIVVDSYGKLNTVLSENSRVWLMAIPSTRHSQSTDTFVRSNFEPVYDAYGVEVWLWDRNKNHYLNPDSGEPNNQLDF